MNLKSPLRRTAVLAAGALIGLSGAFALAGPASAHHNIVKGESSCDKVAGEWVVDWKVQAVGNAPTYKWTEVTLTPAGTTIDNQDLKVNGKDLENNKPLTGVQRVPGSESSSSLTVKAVWTTGNASETGTVTFEGKCEKTPTEEPSTPTEEPSTPTEEPSTPPVIPSDLPGEPEPIFEADCDTMTIGLDNPADGIEFTLKFKTSKGETRTLVIKPGEKKTETFSATTGFKIDLTISATVDGKAFSETIPVEYEQPEDCDNSGSGGGLPLTGAAAGSIAGGAGALLAVGAGLFFMARRRKVKFTA
ncbi:LPXTG cell wall anchor domain-containing protein [Actinoplanes sp. NPDC048791]|uniref:LPXTG cell wall anchor domain-containing protein n=1 Tax=Actinoplanes sp. NPDC048791 TaxID=3154623 RepID=UPI0033F3FD0A